MKQYNVTGMSCAACQARVEKAVGCVPGVTSCAVSLLTNSMGVEGDADDAAIISAVTAAGYGASPKGEAAAPAARTGSADDALADHETPVLRKRLIASVGFLLLLMYLSMGHLMWGFPLPAVLSENVLALALTEMLLTIIVMLINGKFFVSGAKSILHRAPNMDALVALGSAAAFLYSTGEVYRMTAFVGAGEMHAAHASLHNLYFESAAMILALITVGKTLEARAKGKTTDALRQLMRLTPETARVRRGEEFVEVPITEVKKGDVFLVRPGENIPCDGIVTDGDSAVNESALTGESIPVDKTAGDTVSAATTNTQGVLYCEATRVGEDTTLAQIIKMVGDAAATKAPIAKIADRVSGIFVPTVIAIACLTAAVWLILGESFGYALARGIAVLVISCPCALGLATPVAIMVGSGVGAKNGILFKTASSLEQTGHTDAVVLDKTGTITEGMPRVTEILPAADSSEEALLSLAASVEALSEHPLARAVSEQAAAAGVTLRPVTDFRALPGSGVTAKTADGSVLFGGSRAAYEAKFGALPAEVEKAADALAENGRTPLFFACGTALLGMIAVADAIKEDSPRAIRELREMGLRVIMLTGDNAKTALAVGKIAGVDEVIAGVLPDGKDAVIRDLQARGHHVMMVGDGINDAPALTRADIGCAIGAGADVAVDAADIVLVRSRLSDVPRAIRLSRAVIRNIHENLFWAFGYNLIGIPLAAGVFIPLLSWELNPMFGAAAMSISSFCVVSNALRLNLTDLGKHKVTHPAAPRTDGDAPELIQLQTEESIMKKTMKIEGMMCPRCEAHVKKALEAIDGVEEAVASHTAGTAVITLSKDVADEVLAAAVRDCDYDVIGFE